MDKTKETGNQVYRSYKDRLFRMVFLEKKELRSWSNGWTIYGRQLVRIPTPRFFVFYNGRDMQPERQVLKLSDAFINPEEDPALELKVVMLNINLGRNKELMEQCHTLLEYAQFVDRLRTCEKSMGREEAVKHTVDTCIREGILRDFLLKYREEAIEMCIFEYDEEETLRQLGQQSYEGGVAVGEEQMLLRKICTKLKKGKTPETIAEELEEDLPRVKAICEAAAAFAPEYDWRSVYEEIEKQKR